MAFGQNFFEVPIENIILEKEWEKKKKKANMNFLHKAKTRRRIYDDSLAMWSWH